MPVGQITTTFTLELSLALAAESVGCLVITLGE